MKSHLLMIRFCALLFLALQAGCLTTSSENPLAQDKESPAKDIGQRAKTGLIGMEQAIAVTTEDASRRYPTLESFKVSTCERARLWVVIYDGGGPEYYVDKSSGAIVLVQRVPQNVKADGAGGASTTISTVSEAEAVRICNKHFADFLVSQGNSKDHVNEYDAVACELTTTWRVFFEYRAEPGQSLATLPNTNPPNYVVDKESGKILYTTHDIVK